MCMPRACIHIPSTHLEHSHSEVRNPKSRPVEHTEIAQEFATGSPNCEQCTFAAVTDRLYLLGEHFHFYLCSLACYSFQTKATKEGRPVAGHARRFAGLVVVVWCRPFFWPYVVQVFAKGEKLLNSFYAPLLLLGVSERACQVSAGEFGCICLHLPAFTDRTCHSLECATYSTLKSFLSARFLFSSQVKLLKKTFSLKIFSHNFSCF